MLINSYIFYSLCFFPLSDPRISRFFAILFFIDHITPYKKILRNFPSRIKSLQHDRLIVAYLFFSFFLVQSRELRAIKPVVRTISQCYAMKFEWQQQQVCRRQLQQRRQVTLLLIERGLHACPCLSSPD